MADILDENSSWKGRAEIIQSLQAKLTRLELQLPQQPNNR